EQAVGPILVIEAHDGEFDALEFAVPKVRLGGAEAKLADFLPIGVGWSAFAYTWNLYDPRPQIVLCQRAFGKRTERSGRAKGSRAGRTLEDSASSRSHSGMLVVFLLFHHEPPFF